MSSDMAKHQPSLVCLTQTSAPELLRSLTLLEGDTRQKIVNCCTLLASSRIGVGLLVDVVVTKDSAGVVNERLSNIVYGFFLVKCVAYAVVENYVKNTWSKFGLVKSMMTTKGIFFFKFRFNNGMESMLENGPWLIRNMELILKNWTLDANVTKENVCNIPVWVKFHDIPITAFTEDGLSAIATKLGTPLMLDSYMTAMCTDSWGRSSYARALIELRADLELKDTIVVAMPKFIGTNGGNSKLVEKGTNFDVVSSTHRTSSEAFGNDDRKPLKMVDDLVNADSDSEVDEVFNEIADFMASTSFKVDKSSKSDSGVGNKRLYEQWRETYHEDCTMMMTLRMTVV
ncbi:zinc knuckle CX2CX4HX4C containing protein [Tanacetum coccineum]